MKIDRSWIYEAPVVDVYAMLCDVSFQQRKTDATSTDGGKVEIVERAEGHVITVHRVLPTDSFPENIRAMLGRTILVVETQIWGAAADDGSRFADLRVEVRGTPASMRGKVGLLADGDVATTVRMNGDLRGGVPIIGSKIEKAAAPSFLHALTEEERVGREYLAER